MAALLGTLNLATCAGQGSRSEFIFDVHTHHLMPSLPWRTTVRAETVQLTSARRARFGSRPGRAQRWPAPQVGVWELPEQVLDAVLPG